MNDLIALRTVTKVYNTDAGPFQALCGIDLSIGRGEFVAIVGKSGSGKSTLMNMITGIDRPTSGEVIINETPIHTMDEWQIAAWRGRHIGVVFQFFQMLPTLSLVENITLPMNFCNTYPRRQRRRRALELLDLVEIADLAYKLPSEVSGGQQQRAAIARALANDPLLICADEPTGSLDTRTAASVFALFWRLVDQGTTIVMVTHDDDLANRVSRTVTISDGAIVEGVPI